MTSKHPIVLAGAIVAALAASSVAQDQPGPGPQGKPGNQGQRPPGMHMPPPIIGALDANHDGIIDKAEIDGAAEALKKLDRNNDGQLTREETMPPRPPHQGGQGGGPQGQGGPGGFGPPPGGQGGFPGGPGGFGPPPGGQGGFPGGSGGPGGFPGGPGGFPPPPPPQGDQPPPPSAQ